VYVIDSGAPEEPVTPSPSSLNSLLLYAFAIPRKAPTPFNVSVLAVASCTYVAALEPS